MARTRSKPAAKSKEKESTPEPTVSNAQPLAPSVDNPPKLFVLPKNTSPESRIITVDNPANETPSRYLFCPEKGFYEFTRIAAPRKTPRSWLITSDKKINGEGEEIEEDKTEGLGSGYITKNADLFLATPIDVLFLILPALAPKSAKDTKQHFLALDDHLDTLSASSRHLKALLAQHTSLRNMMEKRMKTFCDTVDAGDETMYRMSQEKLLKVLVKKAERMCRNGLPGSMEDRFIKPQLEIPIMSVKREESTISIVSTTTETQADNTQETAMADSQASTAATTTPVDSQATTESQSTTATSFSASEDIAAPSLKTPPEVPYLLRLRTSLNYILSAYVPSTLRSPLRTLLAASTETSFAALDEHLAALSKLKSEAAALRAISDNISRKRGYEDDEEKIAEREEKKRKKEEEEKKKKTESRSIKQLKKADTSGMQKLSAFFTKVPAKKT
jgi:hypothetical protein